MQLLITHNKQTYKHMQPHSLTFSFIKCIKICGSPLPTELQMCKTQWTIQGKWHKKNEVRILWRSRWRSGVLWGVHREVVAFMEIASQHPIVSGLSGRSNLGAEVVVFCTLADQKSCHIQWSNGFCYTSMSGLSWVLEMGEGLVKWIFLSMVAKVFREVCFSSGCWETWRLSAYTPALHVQLSLEV